MLSIRYQLELLRREAQIQDRQHEANAIRRTREELIRQQQQNG